MNYNVPPEVRVTLEHSSPKLTLTGDERTSVLYSLSQAMTEGLLDESNYWGANLLASGFHAIVWDHLMVYYLKYINYLNPALLEYLIQQNLLYLNIKKLYVSNPRNLCNNQELRNHLSEAISLLCLSKKAPLEIPEQSHTFKMEPSILTKTQQFLEFFMGKMSVSVTLSQNFEQFVSNYFCGQLDNCLYYLDWFVKDETYVVEIDMDFKVPNLLAKKSLLLVWKFIILQTKTQIRLGCRGLLQQQNQTDMSELVTDLFNDVMTLYMQYYKKKAYETCVYLITYMLMMSQNLSLFEQSPQLNLTHSGLLQQCLRINLTYQHLYDKSQKKPEKKSDKKKISSKESRPDFFSDPVHQEYMKALYDIDSLEMRQVHPSSGASSGASSSSSSSLRSSSSSSSSSSSRPQSQAPSARINNSSPDSCRIAKGIRFFKQPVSSEIQQEQKKPIESKVVTKKASNPECLNSSEEETDSEQNLSGNEDGIILCETTEENTSPSEQETSKETIGIELID